MKKVGSQTFKPQNPPYLISTGVVAGPFEGRGILNEYLDHVYDDLNAGQSSYEAAEKHMMLNASLICLNKARKTPEEVDLFLAGDLLNQTITSGFTALELAVPYLGIYGACATSAQGMGLGALILDGGYASLIQTATSSHYGSAERQYRYPTEYGYQRRPTAQWTVTGAGSALLAVEGKGPRITLITLGKVWDLGIKDPFNLGTAMAPAACQTLIQHFADTGRGPRDYDLILTGDLGKIGGALLVQLVEKEGGFNLRENYNDCGMMIYDREKQDVHGGASGCASSALVVFGYIYRLLKEGRVKKVLLVATGALHSPTSFQQGENIPAIAHGVSIEA